jgi:hypothetical protein
MQQPVFVSEVRGEVFAQFHAVVCGIDRFACQEEFFVNNPFNVKALDLLFTCLAFFSLGEFGLPVYGSCFLPRTFV